MDGLELACGQSEYTNARLIGTCILCVRISSIYCFGASAINDNLSSNFQMPNNNSFIVVHHKMAVGDLFALVACPNPNILHVIHISHDT